MLELTDIFVKTPYSTTIEEHKKKLDDRIDILIPLFTKYNILDVLSIIRFYVDISEYGVQCFNCGIETLTYDLAYVFYWVKCVCGKKMCSTKCLFNHEPHCERKKGCLKCGKFFCECKEEKHMK